MYTMDCKNPECIKCKQASKGQSSEEKNESKIPTTASQNSKEEFQRKHSLENMIAFDLRNAAYDKIYCTNYYTYLKNEVHQNISDAIKILRVRESELCCKIDQELYSQLRSIDTDVKCNSVNRIMKRYDENRRRESREALCFSSDLDGLKKKLKSFGRLKYKDNILKYEQSRIKMWALNGNAPSSPETIAKIAEDALASANILGAYNETDHKIVNEEQLIRFRPTRLQSEETKKKLEELAANLKNLNADMMRNQHYMSAKFLLGEQNDIDYSLVNCTGQLPILDETDTLSDQIKKRFEMLDKKLNEYCRQQEEAKRSSENAASSPGEDSLEKDSAVLSSNVPETDIKSNETASESEDSENEDSENEDSESEGSESADSESEDSESADSEKADSLPGEDVEKDSSLDEDDIEIISRNEADSIPSDLSVSPPLPPKNRFKFGGKPSCFSLLRKKRNEKPNLSSEGSDIGGSGSDKSSMGGTVSSVCTTEVKVNRSFDKPLVEKSSSECLGASKDGGQGDDPSVALRSSFTKYLEKDPESQWLATGKSSGRVINIPIMVEECDHVNAAQYYDKSNTYWLYRAPK